MWERDREREQKEIEQRRLQLDLEEFTDARRQTTDESAPMPELAEWIPDKPDPELRQWIPEQPRYCKLMQQRKEELQERLKPEPEVTRLGGMSYEQMTERQNRKSQQSHEQWIPKLRRPSSEQPRLGRRSVRSGNAVFKVFTDRWSESTSGNCIIGGYLKSGFKRIIPIPTVQLQDNRLLARRHDARTKAVQNATFVPVEGLPRQMSRFSTLSLQTPRNPSGEAFDLWNMVNLFTSAWCSDDSRPPCQMVADSDETIVAESQRRLHCAHVPLIRLPRPRQAASQPMVV